MARAAVIFPGLGRPESARLKDFGGKLYDAVFQHELRDILQRSLSVSRAQHMGMRLRLRLVEYPTAGGAAVGISVRSAP